MPVVFKVGFEDGTSMTKKLPVEIWQRQDTWNYNIDSPKKVKFIDIDPQRYIPDVDMTDNSWIAE